MQDYEAEGNPVVNRITGLALSLINYNNEVTVICPNNNLSKTTELFQLNNLGIRYHKFDNQINKNSLLFTNYYPGINLYNYLNNILLKEKIDLVVFYGASYLLYYRSVKLCQSMNIKCIVDLTELYPISFKRIFSPNFWDHFYFRTSYIKRFDGVITISNYLYNYLKPKKISSIRIPAILIDDLKYPNEFQHTTQSGFNITYMGVLSKRDLPDTMFKAIISLIRLGYDINFTIVGNISKQKKGRYYKKLIEKKGDLNNRIKFTGWVKDDDLIQIKENTSLFILLRKNDIFSNACFATRIPEYLYTSKPVLLSSIDEFVSTFNHKENVYFVKPTKSSSAVSRALLYLYNNRSLMDRIGENGKTFAQEYLSTKFLGKSLNIFMFNLTKGAK